MFETDAIIACASGLVENSAIKVIRISGFKNLSDFQSSFSVNLTSLIPRTVYCSKVIDGEKALDEVLVCFFAAPSSYNAENIFEISVHGNILNTNNIINYLLNRHHLRMARPGEFTYRALKNKKLSLTQVEGLDLLLNAQTTYCLSEGQSILNGKLDRSYQQLLDKYLKLKSSVEMSIDFLEDIGEENANDQFISSANDLSEVINSLVSKTKIKNSDLITPQVVLIGPVNAGKSTLFNRLLNTDRSIVSSRPGTTRDYISESLLIGGNFFRLIDSAGLRKTSNEIEKEGIDRVLKLAQDSFFKVLVINPFDFDLNKFKKYLDLKYDLIVYTHADLEGFEQKCLEVQKQIKLNGPIEPAKKSGPIEPVKKSGPIEPDKKSGPIEPDKKSGPIEPVKKSGPIEPAKKGGPIEPVKYFCSISDGDRISPKNDVREVLSSIERKYSELSKDNPIIIDRHIESIRLISSSFNDFLTNTKDETDIGIISSQLNIVGKQIEQLVGIITDEDVLGNIFSNFCIGK